MIKTNVLEFLVHPQKKEEKLVFSQKIKMKNGFVLLLKSYTLKQNNFNSRFVFFYLPSGNFNCVQTLFVFEINDSLVNWNINFNIASSFLIKCSIYAD